ncbi:hypothetical protein EV356DRAFT_275498 [Viridothelium virens]|uniref:Cora-domain-containing protein n=1 Tax=Viridothelium virens TaxID=1048519 RepID=A0A6A6H1C9_VIRVR|nr:hypothetical protein EV356DRAFT_275498 [Viridothelium virens]
MSVQLKTLRLYGKAGQALRLFLRAHRVWLLFQTPKDSGGFFSVSIRAPSQNDISVLEEGVSYEFHETELPMVFIALTFMEHHVDQSRSDLMNLMQEVDEIERWVTDDSRHSDLGEIVHRINSSSTALIRLERRWHFESNALLTIQDIIDKYKTMKLNKTLEIKDFHIENGSNVTVDLLENTPLKLSQVLIRDEGFMHIRANSTREGLTGHQLEASTAFIALNSQSVSLRRRSRASEYDLRVLPRRIENQFAAVCSLLLSTIDLTAATLRDSSSMKTIAAMTLIFLPATFVSSFFSMSFFDWKATPGSQVMEPLWIYFTVVIPLTTIVILAWRLWSKRNRRQVNGLSPV